MRLVLEPGADVAALVRGAGASESLLAIFAPGRTPLDRATALAAIAPLAIELAPATRLNAIVPEAEADPQAVEAAAAYLEAARSTTGQILHVTGDDAPARTTPAIP